MSARATLAAWFDACLASTKATNCIRTPAGVKYCIDYEPRELKNGALVGSVHRFAAGGLTYVGAFKISAAGAIEQIPPELAGHLPSVDNPADAPITQEHDHEQSPEPQ